MKRRDVLVGGLGLCVAGVPAVASAAQVPRVRITWPGEVHEMALEDGEASIGERHVDAECVLRALEFRSVAAFRYYADPVLLIIGPRNYTFKVGSIESPPPRGGGCRAFVIDRSAALQCAADGTKLIPGRNIVGVGYSPTGPELPVPYAWTDKYSSGGAMNVAHERACIDPYDWIPRVEVNGRVVLDGAWPGANDGEGR